jgi:hypothetical protein
VILIKGIDIGIKRLANVKKSVVIAIFVSRALMEPLDHREQLGNEVQLE